ncbi:phage tail protein [Planktotalea sp.]|uniref:phage tail protein n=1 Tax=Planktotalea sp. TaxID=2029877 RepID=UPI003D6AD13C
MLGLFGTSVIGTDHLTGPTSDSEEKSARFVRHDVLRGKPILQDLGNDAGTKQLEFHFDEVFCDPEAELRKIDLAFQARVPMRLFFDLLGFELGVFQIERMRIKRKKTTAAGRVVRIDLEVELLESSIGFGGLLGVAAGIGRAISSPFLKRG